MVVVLHHKYSIPAASSDCYIPIVVHVLTITVKILQFDSRILLKVFVKNLLSLERSM